MTFNFAEDAADTMDGFDTGPEEAVAAPAEPPVPGYAPQQPQNKTEAGYLFQAPTQEAEEEYEAVMQQVDRRMKVAQYFRMVLDNSMFDDGSPESRIAESRIRKYVREELEYLFGMRQQPQAAAVAGTQFSPEEVECLRKLCVRLMKPAEPQFKAISTPKTVVAKQLQALIPAPARPQQQQPQRPPQQQPKPTPVAVAPQQDPRIPPQYRDDPTAKVVAGKVYIQSRNADGEPLWSKAGTKVQPVMKDVTPQARPTGVQPLPMPSIAQSNMIETQRAGENLQLLERLALVNPAMRQIAGGVALSLTKED